MLSGDQLRGLETAILDAYRSADQLERLVAFHLDRQLSHFADPHSPLPAMVFRLIQAAQSQGWLDSLIDAVRADRPENTALQSWVVVRTPVAAPATLADHEILDSTFFDLDPIKRQVQAVKRASAEQVLGFGLHTADGLVVSKLCSWLPHCFGEIDRKDWLSLRPDRGQVDYHVKQVQGFASDLDDVHVVCPILTTGASPAIVAAFWEEVRRLFRPYPKRFIALFVGAVEYPAGIVELPAPAADVDDLTSWFQQIMYRRGWPPDLADAWAASIVSECSTGDGLDMRRLFDEMDRSIRKMRRSPADFRRQLEEWGFRADSSPR